MSEDEGKEEYDEVQADLKRREDEVCSIALSKLIDFDKLNLCFMVFFTII